MSAAALAIALFTLIIGVIGFRQKANADDVNTLNKEIDKLRGEVSRLEEKLKTAEAEKQKLLEENIGLRRRIAKLERRAGLSVGE